MCSIADRDKDRGAIPTRGSVSDKSWGAALDTQAHCLSPLGRVAAGLSLELHSLQEDPREAVTPSHLIAGK